MKKLNTLLFTFFVMAFGCMLEAQVTYTAHDFIIPYDGVYHPGINLGYYGPTWDDNTLGDLAAGNETSQTKGIGIKALRGSLPEGLGRTFTYDIWIDKYDYNNAIGTTDNTLFLGFASAEHRDTVDYCPSNDFDTDMFANLYEPIWDNGENGTPVNDENYYALYVYEVVSRLHEKVKFWEIWNEPGFDFTFSTGFLQPGQPGNWWENNPDPCDYKLRAPIFHYIRTLRISYEVIKSIAPDDYVCIAGLGFDSFLDALLRNTDNPDDGKVTAEYPLGAGAYFDVIGFHVYPHIDGTTRFWDPSINDFRFTRHSDAAAEALEKRQMDRQKVLDAYGYDGVTYPRKEWFATEVNVPSTPIIQAWGSEEVQRNYAMKVNMKAMELDFTQIHLFVLGDFKNEDQAGSEFDLMGSYKNLFGIGPGQEEVKESGIGLKTMSDALFGSRYDAARTEAMNLPDDVGGGAYRFEDGTYTYALWAKTQNDLSENVSTNYSFPTPLNLSSLIRKEWDFSQTGNRINQNANNISLTAAPIFLRRAQDDPDVSLEVSCNMDIEIRATATTPEGGAVVSWPPPTATTNCPGGVTIEQTQGISNGEFFPFGVHEMQYTITNACGQSKLCAFNVAVASTGGGIGDCNLFRWEMGFVGQYKDNKYFVSKVKKNFVDAQAQAASHGGYLVSIDSPEENEFLRQQVNDLAMIGYNDVAVEGMLEWTSGKEVVYANVANCQGCQNSDFGDVVMFNHFNGEWYFVGQDAVEYFIMELPCGEIEDCFCTTEFDPVCGPDGELYSNSCVAECAGVFDYSSCEEECDLTQQEWLQDTLNTFLDCELDITQICVSSIESFEFDDNNYVAFYEHLGPCVDSWSSIFSCEGGLICREGGLQGFSECSDFFGNDFPIEGDILWSQDECGSLCILDIQFWLQDTLNNFNNCVEGTYECTSSIESFSFDDNTYVAFYGDLGPCFDFYTDIFSCDGTQICREGGFAGLTECSQFFGVDFPIHGDTLWSQEDCEQPCVLDGQEWLENLISIQDCSNPDVVISTFVQDGMEYVIFDDGSNAASDGGFTIYNCDGSILCTEAGFGSPLCANIFGPDFMPQTTILWSAEEMCPSTCDIEEKEWLADKIEALNCDGCVLSLQSFERNDSVFVVEWLDETLCEIGGYSIRDCEGILVCLEGGTQGSTECSNMFGDIGNLDIELIWSKEEDCEEECDILNQAWLPGYLDSIDCSGCVDRVDVIEVDGVQFIYEFPEFENLECFLAFQYLYDCNGDIVCRENGDDTLPMECTNFLMDADSINVIETLWSKEADCELCELDNQEWLNELLNGESLCESCITSISSYSGPGGFDEYILVLSDTTDCNEAEFTVYRCDGTIFCTDDADGHGDCTLFTGFANFEEVLWDKEFDCEPNATSDLKVQDLNLFPNPTSELIQVYFKSEYSTTFDVSIVDITGKRILEREQQIVAGENRIKLSLQSLVEGMYFIQLMDKESATYKMLKFVKANR